MDLGTRSSDLRLVSSASMARPRHPSDVEEGHTVPGSTIWTMVDGALYWSKIHQDFHDGLTSAALVQRYFCRLFVADCPTPSDVAIQSGDESRGTPARCRGDEEAASPPRRRSVLPSPLASTRRYVVRLFRQPRRRRRSRRREDRHPLQTDVERAASKSAVSAITGVRTKYCKPYLETMLSANGCRCRATCTSNLFKRANVSAALAAALLRVTE